MMSSCALGSDMLTNERFLGSLEKLSDACTNGNVSFREVQHDFRDAKHQRITAPKEIGSRGRRTMSEYLAHGVHDLDPLSTAQNPTSSQSTSLI